ncbi:MAG: hypothetical protein M9916_08825 [Crocinitomicaceae bacterium]|nr:hypothetical protein [Crocinitomicaceae bacterium]
MKKDSKSIYKFNGIKEYNEFAMPQRIERFKTMINNDIDVNYKKHTIVLTIPTDGIKESDLTKIISTISKVHGFQSYSVTEIEGEK